MEGARGRRCFCVSKAKAPDPAAAELVGLRQGELSQRARAARVPAEAVAAALGL